MVMYKDYQDRITLINYNMIGLKVRNNNNPSALPDGSPAPIFTPPIKNYWGIVDRIRGCLGQYLTIYDSNAYRNYPGGLLPINYAAYAKQVKMGNDEGGAHDVVNGSLKQQLQNIILDYSISASAPFESYEGPGVLSVWAYTAQRSEALQLTLNYGNFSEWPCSVDEYFDQVNNQYAIPPSADWRSAGVDNWLDFIGTGEYLGPFGGVYEGLMKGVVVGDMSFMGSIYDHTAKFYGPPNELKIREKSGMLFDVSPTYNFYVQATVPYEEVVADTNVPEYLLSNVYYLQHELANTSSTLLAPWHLDALTLRQHIPYFEVVHAQSVTEANTREYYHMYTDGLQNLLFEKGPALETTKETLADTNKKLAVLHSDLKALNKNSIHLSTVPFYNTIAIGAWQDQITGYADNKSILNALYNQKETRGFIDVLQYLAISSIGSSNVASGSFALATSRAERSSLIQNGEKQPLYNTQQMSVDILFDLGDMCGWLSDGYTGVKTWIPASNVAAYMNDQGQTNTIFNSNTFKRIRDYGNLDLTINPQSIQTAVERLFSDPGSDAASIAGVMRPMNKVYDNAPCHTETLLYIVEKRQLTRTDQGEELVGPVVQTFYISPSMESRLPLYYYDAQVKYNQEYAYQISKVVLVFGNEYYYEDPQPSPLTPTNRGPSYDQYSHGPLRMNAQIKNRSSVKAMVIPHMIGNLNAPPIIDKPPIEPEISFYSYKGVNNKLLILMNAGTGRHEESPVEILETDKKYFEEEYFAQKREIKSFEDIKDQGDKLMFRSDDPVDRYQLFKLDITPKSYQDFSNSLLPEIDPTFGIAGTLIDRIEPNRKYYYCARSIDMHENVSNPTHIFEIEMIDNNGQIFLKQKVFNFEKQHENFVKSGRRFIYIEPSLQQLVFDPAGYGQSLDSPALGQDPPTNLLGAQGVTDQVWGKGFKVRLTSKKTGRKMDLNINFTNTGKVKPSE